MAKPTYSQLDAADTVLFDLMEWDQDMRTWERQVIRDVRKVLHDRQARLKTKADHAGKAEDGQADNTESIP